MLSEAHLITFNTNITHLGVRCWLLRATTTTKIATTPRTRVVFLPKAHSAAPANLLALALVLSTSAARSVTSGDELTMNGEGLLPYSPKRVEIN